MGATIPESSDLTLSTAQLQAKLIGKAGSKHSRDEENTHNETIDMEDGESRAGAIKKKARTDPFNEHKNKKHKHKNKEKARVDSVMRDHPVPPLKPLFMADGGTPSNSVTHSSSLPNGEPVTSNDPEQVAKESRGPGTSSVSRSHRT